jgi:beta-phosphoglucomutase-like phosphatase (HAD superfamily)
MPAPAPAALPQRSPRPLTRPAAVIFDMDGLMLDTEPLAARAWTVAAQRLGIDFDHAVTPRLVGRNFPDCRALIRDHHGDRYPVDALMRAWADAYDAIVAREGIGQKTGLAELLAWLEREHIPKAVATSTRRARAQVKLVEAALFDRFAALVGGDEIANGKPAPDIFVEAAARLGVAAAECVVLEDSEPGINAALAARMIPIMVPDLTPPSAALLARAPLVLLTLREVHAHLAALPVAERVR